MSKFADPKWRNKNTYKWLREMARLMPETKPDVDAVLRQRIVCAVWFIAYVPVLILWVPFYLIGVLAELITGLCNAIYSGLLRFSSPRFKAYRRLFELTRKAEHGDYKTRLHVLKDRFGWNFESWHYVNQEDTSHED